MEMVTLGKTGRSVSRIGFGGAPAGLKNYLHAYDPRKTEDRELVLEAIGKALELGINYFDVAPGYGDGVAEEIFGEALARATAHSVFLATKVGVWKEEPVRPSLEASLGRLRRSQVDLLQIHGTVYNDDHIERVLRPGGILDQMEALRAEGLVRHIGFTCESENEAVYRFIKTGRFEVIQTCYNLLFQHPYDVGWKSGSLYEAEK